VRLLLAACMVLQIPSLVLQENIYANVFFENILIEHLLAGCASMFKPLPVTSIGGSVNEQIPGQLPRCRSLRMQAAAYQALPRHVFPFL
jgi:hypothetical protein